MEIPTTLPQSQFTENGVNHMNAVSSLSAEISEEFMLLSQNKLRREFQSGTHEDEASRLANKLSSTVDTLNKILQKV